MVIETISPPRTRYAPEYDTLPAYGPISESSMVSEYCLPEHSRDDKILAMLYRIGTIDKNFIFIKEIPPLHIALEGEGLQNFKKRVSPPLVFPIFYNDASYEIEIPYKEMAKQIQSSHCQCTGKPLASFRIDGSDVPKIIGASSLKQILGSHLHGAGITFDACDWSHISDAADTDTHVETIISQDCIIHEIIRRHLDLLQFKIGEETTDLWKVREKYLFVNTSTIPKIEVACPKFSWLNGRTLEGAVLKEFWKNLFTIQDPIEFACHFIFKKSPEGVKRLIIGKHAGKYLKFTQGRGGDKPRMVCKNKEGGIHDMSFLPDSNAPSVRTTFQQISLELISWISERLLPMIKGSIQAFFDKAFRLLRFVNLEHTDHTDWCFYWQQVTKGYHAMQREALPIVTKNLKDFCQTCTDAVQAIYNEISYCLKKHNDDSFETLLCTLFNAFPSLHFLPEGEKTRIWDILKAKNGASKIYNPFLQAIAQALFEKTCAFEDIQTALEIAACLYLLAPADVQAKANAAAEITHNLQEPCMRFSIEGQKLLLPVNPRITLQKLLFSQNIPAIAAIIKACGLPAFEKADPGSHLFISSSLLNIDPYSLHDICDIFQNIAGCQEKEKKIEILLKTHNKQFSSLAFTLWKGMGKEARAKQGLTMMYQLLAYDLGTMHLILRKLLKSKSISINNLDDLLERTVKAFAETHDREISLRSLSIFREILHYPHKMEPSKVLSLVSNILEKRGLKAGAHFIRFLKEENVPVPEPLESLLDPRPHHDIGYRKEIAKNIENFFTLNTMGGDALASTLLAALQSEQIFDANTKSIQQLTKIDTIIKQMDMANGSASQDRLSMLHDLIATISSDSQLTTGNPGKIIFTRLQTLINAKSLNQELADKLIDLLMKLIDGMAQDETLVLAAANLLTLLPDSKDRFIPASLTKEIDKAAPALISSLHRQGRHEDMCFLLMQLEQHKCSYPHLSEEQASSLSKGADALIASKKHPAISIFALNRLLEKDTCLEQLCKIKEINSAWFSTAIHFLLEEKNYPECIQLLQHAFKCLPKENHIFFTLLLEGDKQLVESDPRSCAELMKNHYYLLPIRSLWFEKISAVIPLLLTRNASNKDMDNIQELLNKDLPEKNSPEYASYLRNVHSFFIHCRNYPKSYSDTRKKAIESYFSNYRLSLNETSTHPEVELWLLVHELRAKSADKSDQTYFQDLLQQLMDPHAFLGKILADESYKSQRLACLLSILDYAIAHFDFTIEKGKDPASPFTLTKFLIDTASNDFRQEGHKNPEAAKRISNVANTFLLILFKSRSWPFHTIGIELLHASMERGIFTKEVRNSLIVESICSDLVLNYDPDLTKVEYAPIQAMNAKFKEYSIPDNLRMACFKYACLYFRRLFITPEALEPYATKLINLLHTILETKFSSVKPENWDDSNQKKLKSWIEKLTYESWQKGSRQPFSVHHFFENYLFSYLMVVNSFRYLTEELNLKLLKTFADKIFAEVTVHYPGFCLEYDNKNMPLKVISEILLSLLEIKPFDNKCSVILLNFILPMLSRVCSEYPCKKTAAKLIKKFTFYPYINEEDWPEHILSIEALCAGSIKDKVFKSNPGVLFQIETYTYCRENRSRITNPESKMQQIELLHKKFLQTPTARFLDGDIDLLDVALRDRLITSEQVLSWHQDWMKAYKSRSMQEKTYSAARLLCKYSFARFSLINMDRASFYRIGKDIMEAFLEFLPYQASLPHFKSRDTAEVDLFKHAVKLLEWLIEIADDRTEILSFKVRLFPYLKPWHNKNILLSATNPENHLSFMEFHSNHLNKIFKILKEVCRMKPSFHNQTFEILNHIIHSLYDLIRTPDEKNFSKQDRLLVSLLVNLKAALELEVYEDRLQELLEIILKIGSCFFSYVKCRKDDRKNLEASMDRLSLQISLTQLENDNTRDSISKLLKLLINVKIK